MFEKQLFSSVVEFKMEHIFESDIFSVHFSSSFFSYEQGTLNNQKSIKNIYLHTKYLYLLFHQVFEGLFA